MYYKFHYILIFELIYKVTLLINKKGEEFARILGSVDFEDKKLIKWLKNFD